MFSFNSFWLNPLQINDLTIKMECCGNNNDEDNSPYKKMLTPHPRTSDNNKHEDISSTVNHK